MDAQNKRYVSIYGTGNDKGEFNRLLITIH